jgi:predicted acyl esterase
MSDFKSEVRDGMRIEWDVPIEMDDGLLVRADIFRPVDSGNCPAIVTYGPYAKWLWFGDAYPDQWENMIARHPEVPEGSSNKYQSWEVVDPEQWVPDGYACVRVDSRGSGRSPGYMNPFSAREAKDFYDCIEWTAAQSWCNGKVGLNGISYYAMNQWQVAALQPPHLAAICVWEGACDQYRDMGYHGGIFSEMPITWYNNSVIPRQHGLGTRGFRSRLNGDWISGPETLAEEELGANRCDFIGDHQGHPLQDKYWDTRRPDLSKITVPLLSAGNWGGHGLHLRGNVEGYYGAASSEKWLEIHGLEHWTHFYTDYGANLQKKFFGHFLKGEDNGWKEQPRVQLQIRHPDEKYIQRTEDEWPLARTQWTNFYLNPESFTLDSKPPEKNGSISYRGFSDGVTFMTPPLQNETEITGPMASKLFVSSETEDTDLFLVVRVFKPDMKEVTFHGAVDPNKPVGLGWLRASQRKLDEKRSLPFRPYHTHDEIQPLTPGEAVELDIEIWPTCIVIPAGYRIGLSVRGKDYKFPGGSASGLKNLPLRFTGVGPYRHVEPVNRPADVFGGEVTLHFGAGQQSYLLLPVIPQK